MSRDGTIIFYEGGIPNAFLRVYKAITGCRITHVGIICWEYYYESSITLNKNIFSYGVTKSPIVNKIGKNVLVPIIPFTESQVKEMARILDCMVGTPYNILKFINMWWIVPLAPLWDFLKWCPFSSKQFGVMCPFIDSVYKELGTDLLPGRDEGYTTPCDFFKSPFLRLEK
jgi:hypothetical protein